MLKTGSLIALISVSCLSYAWVCPNNFTQIGPGDTIEQVVAKCGKPASEKASEGAYRGPQEWQYFITVTNPLLGSGVSPQAAPSVKMTIAFVDRKAINITVQGTSLASTSLCGPTINIGDTDESIMRNCGKPVFIQKQDSGAADNKPIEIIEYKYNNAPPNTLIFENGVLTDRK